MRKIILLVSLIFLVSCAKNVPVLNEKSDIEETFLVKEYSIPSLVKEKFLEFYDLKILLKNKPEFKESIEKRLSNFKLDSSNILELNRNSTIKNLKIIESDSLNINTSLRLKIIFDINEKTTSKKDSLIVFVFEKNFTLDGEKITSKKIKFARFKSSKK